MLLRQFSCPLVKRPVELLFLDAVTDTCLLFTSHPRSARPVMTFGLVCLRGWSVNKYLFYSFLYFKMILFQCFRKRSEEIGKDDSLRSSLHLHPDLGKYSSSLQLHPDLGKSSSSLQLHPDLDKDTSSFQIHPDLDKIISSLHLI